MTKKADYDETNPNGVAYFVEAPLGEAPTTTSQASQSSSILHKVWQHIYKGIESFSFSNTGFIGRNTDTDLTTIAMDFISGTIVAGLFNSSRYGITDVIDLSTDPNLTEGILRISKEGSQVSLLFNTVRHPSSNNVSSATGLIPEQFRPNTAVNNIYSVHNDLRQITIKANGQIQLRYFQSDDPSQPVAKGSSGGGFCITYTRIDGLSTF